MSSSTSLEVFWCYACNEGDATKWFRCQRRLCPAYQGSVALCHRCSAAKCRQCGKQIREADLQSISDHLDTLGTAASGHDSRGPISTRVGHGQDQGLGSSQGTAGPAGPNAAPEAGHPAVQEELLNALFKASEQLCAGGAGSLPGTAAAAVERLRSMQAAILARAVKAEVAGLLGELAGPCLTDPDVCLHCARALSALLGESALARDAFSDLDGRGTLLLVLRRHPQHAHLQNDLQWALAVAEGVLALVYVLSDSQLRGHLEVVRASMWAVWTSLGTAGRPRCSQAWNVEQSLDSLQADRLLNAVLATFDRLEDVSLAAGACAALGPLAVKGRRELVDEAVNKILGAVCAFGSSEPVQAHGFESLLMIWQEGIQQGAALPLEELAMPVQQVLQNHASSRRALRAAAQFAALALEFPDVLGLACMELEESACLRIMEALGQVVRAASPTIAEDVVRLRAISAVTGACSRAGAAILEPGMRVIGDLVQAVLCACVRQGEGAGADAEAEVDAGVKAAAAACVETSEASITLAMFVRQRPGARGAVRELPGVCQALDRLRQGDCLDAEGYPLYRRLLLWGLLDGAEPLLRALASTHDQERHCQTFHVLARLAAHGQLEPRQVELTCQAVFAISERFAAGSKELQFAALDALSAALDAGPILSLRAGHAGHCSAAVAEDLAARSLDFAVPIAERYAQQSAVLEEALWLLHSAFSSLPCGHPTAHAWRGRALALAEGVGVGSVRSGHLAGRLAEAAGRLRELLCSGVPGREPSPKAAACPATISVHP